MARTNRREVNITAAKHHLCVHVAVKWTLLPGTEVTPERLPTWEASFNERTAYVRPTVWSPSLLEPAFPGDFDRVSTWHSAAIEAGLCLRGGKRVEPLPGNRRFPGAEGEPPRLQDLLGKLGLLSLRTAAPGWCVGEVRVINRSKWFCNGLIAGRIGRWALMASSFRLPLVVRLLVRNDREFRWMTVMENHRVSFLEGWSY